MPTDNGHGAEARHVAYQKVDDFITHRHDQTLRSLRLTNTSVSELLTDLAGYLSVLNGGGSIAFARGEDLTSVHLSQSTEKLFRTAPSVREGPPLSWTTIVLAVGPHFEGPSQLTIGESVIELSEHDLALLRSGRPWRFLHPWPDEGDCRKELESSATTLQELSDARQVVQEGKHPHHLLSPNRCMAS